MLINVYLYNNFKPSHFHFHISFKSDVIFYHAVQKLIFNSVHHLVNSFPNVLLLYLNSFLDCYLVGKFEKIILLFLLICSYFQFINLVEMIRSEWEYRFNNILGSTTSLNEDQLIDATQICTMESLYLKCHACLRDTLIKTTMHDKTRKPMLFS